MSFCGSYLLYGMPLLENAVESAVSVAESLGASAPWRTEKVRKPPKQVRGTPASGGVVIVALGFLAVILIVADLTWLI